MNKEVKRGRPVYGGYQFKCSERICENFSLMKPHSAVNKPCHLFTESRRIKNRK